MADVSITGLLQLLQLHPLWGGGFWVALCQVLLLYYGYAVILHWVIPAVLPVQHIQPSTRKPGEVARDALSSIVPLAIKACGWYFVEQMQARGYTQLYTGPVSSLSEVAYILLSLVLMQYFNDTLFYWTHRALHWRPLYRRVHWMHHRAVAPSAFNAYAFHGVEALVSFSNEWLEVFCFPIHMGVHRMYHMAAMLYHMGGHSGYEMHPFVPTLEHMAALLLFGPESSSHFSTVQHHDQHHRFPSKNFSLYFTHWDRWCGTLHPLYDQKMFKYFA